MPVSLRTVLDDVRRLLDERPGRVVIGLTGPPGVGKSTVARQLSDGFAGVLPSVPMDGFHLSNAQLERLGRRDRKGASDTFDTAGYVAILERVVAAYGQSDVYVPDFSHGLGEPVAAGLVVPRDARLVLTEGNYLALADGGWGPVRGLLDRLYYLDGPADLRRSRLIRRHVATGRTEAAATAWVDTVDEPNAAVIATTETRCDATLYLDDR